MADARCGQLGAGQPHAVADRGDFPPADPVGQVPVGDLDSRRVGQRGRGVESALDAGGQQPGLPRRLRQFGGLHGPGQHTAVHRHDDAAGYLRALRRGPLPSLALAEHAVSVEIQQRAQLQGRDLGMVDHRTELDPVGRQLQAGVVVHRDVAQRVRGCSAGHSERQGGHQETSAEHEQRAQPRAPADHCGPRKDSRVCRAMGACSGEKCGLVASASSRAAIASPVRAASVQLSAARIIPRW